VISEDSVLTSARTIMAQALARNLILSQDSKPRDAARKLERAIREKMAELKDPLLAELPPLP
jgi:uncharacterized protein YyaL (SSP411 family)